MKALLPIGGFVYAAGWVISIVVAFSESTGWGIVFLMFGVTGPLAGLIEGLAWNNWTALIVSGIGIGIAIVGALGSDDDS
jgi:hypothetical protein